jgi:hypothetical protein
MDVAALYADSLMNLTPWGLWDLKTGEPALGRRIYSSMDITLHRCAASLGILASDI